MALLPSIFGESLLDNFFDDDFFRVRNPWTVTKTGNLMKTDVKEMENGYELSVELPGYKKENVNVTLENGYLNIEAGSNQETEKKDEAGRVIRRERYTGAMSRSFYVGEDIKEEDIRAKFTDGILTLTVPKKDPQEQVPQKKTILIEE